MLEIRTIDGTIALEVFQSLVLLRKTILKKLAPLCPRTGSCSCPVELTGSALSGKLWTGYAMTRKTWASKRFLPIGAAVICPFFVVALGPVPTRAQLSTNDHLAEPGWWPRREPGSLNEFVGNPACAKCHSRITASQEATPMARTLMRAVNADVLHSRSDLAFRNGKYLYQIKANDTAPQLTVTDGESAITANLVWAFGAGKLGQSYLFLQNGSYRESRVTYFSSLQNLSFTPARCYHHTTSRKPRLVLWIPPSFCDAFPATALERTSGDGLTRAKPLWEWPARRVTDPVENMCRRWKPVNWCKESGTKKASV